MILPVKPGSQGFFSAKVLTSVVIFSNIIFLLDFIFYILFGRSFIKDLPQDVCDILFVSGGLISMIIVALKYRRVTQLKKAKQIMVKHNIDGTGCHLLISLLLFMEIITIAYLHAFFI